MSLGHLVLERAIHPRYTMPIYSFSLKVGSHVVESGTRIELADEGAALAHAWMIGRALLSFLDRGDDWVRGMLIVEDDCGLASFVLPLSDVAERKRHTSTH